MVFTKRSDRMLHHRGQISFPGGGHEPKDASLLDTALRESDEEIGLNPSHVKVLGQLVTAVKRLVEAHKGSIRVESNLGQGTRFIILLPRSQAVATA